MTKKPRKELVEAIAMLLSQKEATKDDFFYEVALKMEEKGYTIECHQHGVNGSYLRVVQLRKT